jgi:hypothetical protein
MKKLFTNYNLEVDKNERKLLITFCKQVLKQTESDEKLFAETKAFSSILTKLNSGDEIIKLTKDEKTKLTLNLKQNIDHLNKEIKKAGFIKKFFFNSLLKQYNSLYDKHLK